MARPLQLIPQGLLGFLQLKNKGRNPVEFPEVLQPTMDLAEWYLQTNGILAPIASVLVANGVRGSTQFTTNPLIVPNDQWWYVLDYGIRVSYAAAESSSFAACWQVPPAGVANVFKVGDDVGSKIDLLTGGTSSLMARAHKFWVPPGGELAVYVNENLTAGNITYTGYLRYVPLPT